MTMVCEGAGCDEEQGPQVIWRGPTTHQYSRAGKSISKIVIHYTTSRNVDGTIDWFKNAPIGERTSAHYIVGRDGSIFQMVTLEMASWHAGSRDLNERSVGIEHVAAPGDRLTKLQSDSSKRLILWLMELSNVELENVIPHKLVRNTNCFGDILLDYGAGRDSTAAEQKAALDLWLAS